MGGRGGFLPLKGACACLICRDDFEHVMSAVMNPIINSFCSRATQQRRFKVPLEEPSTEYGDLLLHTEIWWLSWEQIMLCFFVTFGWNPTVHAAYRQKPKMRQHNRWLLTYLIDGQMKTDFAKNSWCQWFTELLFSFSFIFLFMTFQAFCIYISKVAQYRECLVTKLQKEKMQKKIWQIHVNSVDITLLIWLGGSQRHFQQDDDPMLLQ